jgi:transcriptional regulator with XRE-family HTH domain
MSKKPKPPSAEVLLLAREKIGAYLRDIRKHRGLSQVELAERTGLRQADISEVENGAINYGIDKLLAYSHGADCYFFLGSRDGKHLDLDHMVKKMRDPI